MTAVFYYAGCFCVNFVNCYGLDNCYSKTKHTNEEVRKREFSKKNNKDIGKKI